MTKGELKSILAELDSVGVADSATIKVEMANADRLDLNQNSFKAEGQDAAYSIDASGHWAPAVSQADCILLLEL